MSYSHGGEGFDLSHFKSMNPKSKEEFYKILSDAITLGVHNRFQDLGEGASSAAALIGDMAEQVTIGLYDDKTGNIIEVGPYDDFNLHISSWGNDGHGFNYAVTEEHGLTVVDTGSNVVGDAGDNPMQEAPYGYDIVSRYDSSWSDEDSDVPGFQANIANNLATNTFTNLGTGWNNKVAWHLDILDDVYGKLKEDGNGEFIWHKIRPAVNTLQYRYREDGDLDPESEVAALNPDNLDDLPDLRNFDEFSAYRNKLREHVEFYGPDDYIGEVNLNLGTDPVESPEISEEVGLRPNEIKELSKPLL